MSRADFPSMDNGARVPTRNAIDFLQSVVLVLSSQKRFCVSCRFGIVKLARFRSVPVPVLDLRLRWRQIDAPAAQKRYASARRRATCSSATADGRFVPKVLPLGAVLMTGGGGWVVESNCKM